jgi:hypothetical protein
VAGRLVQELGYLPLALEQAAAYIDRTHMSPGQYLDLLVDRADEVYRRGTVAGHEATIATLWDLTLDRIAPTAPAAVQLLEICAFLAPEPTPLDLFTDQPDLLPDPLRSVAADPLEFTDAVAVLIDYSLAKRTDADISIHRLTQSAIRQRIHANGTAARGQP